MTHLYDDPATFMEDMVAGFAKLYPQYVTPVSGGVVRSVEPKDGKVAVVVGGGSGHYPAFCGVVGEGFADGAVIGNIFTSPSADDAYNVAKAASAGGGVLFITGNYAGDVLNFNQATARLRDEGMDVLTLYVTDDVASAPRVDEAKRRGIAGDFTVFKVAGAAGDAGYSLAEVERVARHANALTRTLGVAFAGCTLPGAHKPLFTVPEGKMGLGLGIHGEPGIRDEDLPTAAGLAKILVDGAAEELPTEYGNKVAVILNGLGATKYEELFVVWKSVAALLEERGYEIVDPEVGELVTSLDMAGCSLTLMALDEELEGFWRAPADTPAFKKGTVGSAPGASAHRREIKASVAPEEATGPLVASDAARACGVRALAALESIRSAMVAAEDELGRIDAVAGDGDHGRGMVKGITAAAEAAAGIDAREGGVGSLLKAAGDSWASKAGGTSGVLWGAAVAKVGARLGDDAETISALDVAEAMRAGLDTITTMGGAKVGDKTMLDSMVPFVETLEAAVGAGDPLTLAWDKASAAAKKAADETAPLRPMIGRARPLADKSVGTPDAGAISFAMAMAAVGDVLRAG
ncbi:MAG: D-erythrulose kinase [Actinobacteria bacterium HGW-Actinobacteria-1]|jgi:dihydroxyacetone kinase|nr:MAG: D-erythrulose kinase [Actinobacteria bacterium HGW-Actinobacteria-1]